MSAAVATLAGMQRGDSAEITVDHLDLSGQSVSELAGRTVLCPGLFPGERAQVRIEALAQHSPRAHAGLEQLQLAHPARRPAPCPNHVARGGACHGCALMELHEGAQREAKRRMLAAEFGLEVAEVEAAPEPLGYRFSSKRVALSVNGVLTLGSFARGSHAPAAMRACMVDHPLLAAAFDELEDAARRLGIAAYDERDGSGDLRAVWAKTDGREVIVTLVVADAQGRARALLPPVLRVAGVLASVQRGPSNALRGGAAELLCGRAELSIALLEQQVEVGALGFLQPNPRMAEAAYGALLGPPQRPAPGFELAFDLYAGAGVTTRALRTQYREVVPCEAYPESALQLGVAAERAETFLARAVLEQRAADLVIANPPRKGLGAAVCAALKQLGAAELRIMSCGPQGLARDIQALGAGPGAYRLLALRAFDTLPQTPHVELVASLVPVAARPHAVHLERTTMPAT